MQVFMVESAGIEVSGGPMKFLKLALLSIVLCMTAPASAQDADGPPQDHEGLLAAFEEILSESTVPGAQIALVEDGALSLTYSYGVSNVAEGTPVTDETVFRAGSISKSFVGVAVMMAQEEGLLSLDTPIAEIVPDVEFANSWEDAEPVRIAHVLEHTAGFFDISVGEFLVSDPDITIAEGLAINPNTRVSRWAPGTYSSYANSGPPIAALALEQVRGIDYDDLLRDTILRPLGMEVSELRLTPEVEARISLSYTGDGTSPLPYGHVLMRPSGALNTTATELSQFMRMLINRGELNGLRLLSPESVARIERSETLEGIEFYGMDVTYGLGNGPQPTEKTIFRGHGGTIDGFLAVYAYSADLRSGIVIMLNQSSGATLQSLMDTVTGYLTRNFEPNLPPPYPVDMDELADYAGLYISRTPRSYRSHLTSPFKRPIVVSYNKEEGLVVEGVPRIPNGEYTMRRPERAESSFARATSRTYRRELRYAEETYEQVSLLRVMQRMVLSYGVGFGALMVLAYSFLYAPISFARRRLSRPRPEKPKLSKYMRTLSLLAAFCVAGLLSAGFYATSLHYLELAIFTEVNQLTLSIFALTVLAPLFAALGIWITITGEGNESTIERSYFVLANGFILVGFLWLFQFGWLGLKTWML